MQKHQLALVFRKTAELLATATFPPEPPASPSQLIQLLSFMADQIEKDLLNELTSTEPTDHDRPAQE